MSVDGKVLAVNAVVILAIAVWSSTPGGGSAIPNAYMGECNRSTPQNC